MNRESKNNSLTSRIVLLFFRALDIPIQYHLLAHDLGAPLITTFGGTPLSHPLEPGLTPYRLIIFLMASIAVIKHTYWVLRISRQELTPFASFSIAILESSTSILNTLFFICTATSVINLPSKDEYNLFSARLLVGGILFVIGISTEWIAEEQRRVFKQDVRNAGKPFMGGFFGLVRHPNYGGYTIWRTGFALACAGWIWGVVVFVLFVLQFNMGSIPELDAYCSKRYGKMWVEYKRKVSYKLLPGIL
ncbi:erg4 erg24 ergosterol biosynthesis-like protein [Moniliophthora roreri]|uniref:Uncharacterized protein n=1 Tax=Moniliophthora roreri TaxID=221103 RepID=A0A0W0F785_MONRR|nr:erg4 erg24 ergosterol biosynthesis-like protein [Moniliophthora roreri]